MNYEKNFFNHLQVAEVESWCDIIKKRKDDVKELFQHFEKMSYEFGIIQIQEIYYGLINDLSVDKILIYAKEEFSPMQMSRIRQDLENKIDPETVKMYANINFLPKQMEAISSCIVSGLKVEEFKRYIDSSNVYCMQTYLNIWEALRSGASHEEIAEYLKYKPEYFKVISHYLIRTRDHKYIKRYCRKNFSPGQLNKVLDYAYAKNFVGKDKLTIRQVDFLANPKFNIKQMEEISLGFAPMRRLTDKILTPKLNFDEVKLYAKPEYSYQKMNEIRKSLQSGLKIEQIQKYIDTEELFDYTQLHVIFEGLLKGYDISVYDKVVYNTDKMKLALKALETNIESKYIEFALNSEMGYYEIIDFFWLIKHGCRLDEIVIKKGKIVGYERLEKKYAELNMNKLKSEIAELLK